MRVWYIEATLGAFVEDLFIQAESAVQALAEARQRATVPGSKFRLVLG